MAEDPVTPQSPPPRARRSSFAGQTFADLFGTGRQSVSRPSNETNNNSSSPPTQQYPGPISQAAAQAQSRRLSLTTLGLSGIPNQTSPFNSFRGRRGSIGSADSGSVNESAIAEDDGPARDPNSGGSPPTTPFARRTSFGARALRDIRTSSFGNGGGGGGGGGNGSPGQNGRSPPATSNGTSNKAAHKGTISSRDAKGRGLSLTLSPSLPSTSSIPIALLSIHELTSLSTLGSTEEGFNWSDNLRTRAQRGSIAGPGAQLPPPNNHSRPKSVAVMEPPAEMPKPMEQKRPDHFQERILKGDFYMD